MVFQGLDTARQIVEIVEHLSECKSQLDDLKPEGGSVGVKLEDITLDLVDIAHRLFKYSLSTVQGEEEQITDKKVYIPVSVGHDVDNIGAVKMDHTNWKSAKICQFGVNCGFGRKGICGFYHPEEGKSREPVCTFITVTLTHPINSYVFPQMLDATPACTFGPDCKRKPSCRFKHVDSNCHLTARGYYGS